MKGSTLKRIDIVNINKRSLLSSCYTIYSTTMTWAKQLRKLSIKCSYFGFSLERETLSNSFLTPPMTPTGLFCLTFSFVAGCLELWDMNCYSHFTYCSISTLARKIKIYLNTRTNKHVFRHFSKLLTFSISSKHVIDETNTFHYKQG